jgi:hypothetical protein
VDQGQIQPARDPSQEIARSGHARWRLIVPVHYRQPESTAGSKGEQAQPGQPARDGHNVCMWRALPAFFGLLKPKSAYQQRAPANSE